LKKVKGKMFCNDGGKWQCSKTGSGSRVGIGIGNFDLGRDRDWKFQLRSGSGFDRDPECLLISF
jgi:hypothetical protein